MRGSSLIAKRAKLSAVVCSRNVGTRHDQSAPIVCQSRLLSTAVGKSVSRIMGWVWTGGLRSPDAEAWIPSRDGPSGRA